MFELTYFNLGSSIVQLVKLLQLLCLSDKKKGSQIFIQPLDNIAVHFLPSLDLLLQFSPLLPKFLEHFLLFMDLPHRAFALFSNLFELILICFTLFKSAFLAVGGQLKESDEFFLSFWQYSELKNFAVPLAGITHIRQDLSGDVRVKLKINLTDCRI